MYNRTIYTSGEEFRKLSDAYNYFFSRGVLNNNNEDTLFARQIVAVINEYTNCLKIIDDKQKEVIT